MSSSSGIATADDMGGGDTDLSPGADGINIFAAVGLPSDLVDLKASSARKLARQLNQLEKTRRLDEQSTASHQRAVESAVARKTAKKSVGKYSKRIFDRAGTDENFGAAPKPNDLRPTLEMLSSAPEVALQRGVGRTSVDILLDGIVDNHNIDNDVSSVAPPSLPVHERVAEGLLRRKEAQQRKLQIMLDQQKFKRLKKIKSRAFRRIRKKALEKQTTKIIDKLAIEQPELAGELREKYEAKRAQLRVLKDQKARSKWAKMARRFGGSSMQPLISEQEQIAKDNRRLAERLAKKRDPNNYDDDDNEDDNSSSSTSTSDDDDDDHVNSDDAEKEALEELAQLVSSQEEGDMKKKKGLYSMRFMEEARLKENQKFKEQAEMISDEIKARKQHQHDNDDDDDDDDNGDDGDNKKIKSFTALENEAKKKLDENAILAKEKLKEILNQYTTKTATNTNQQTKANENNVDVDLMSKTRKRKRNDRIGEDSIRSNPLETVFNEFEANRNSKAKEILLSEENDQTRIVQEAFAQYDDHHDDHQHQHQDDDDDDDAIKLDSSSLSTKDIDWRNWTGEGITPSSSSSSSKKTKKNMKIDHYKNDGSPSSSLMKKSKEAKMSKSCLSEKASKYFVTETPFPYATKLQYESFLKKPIGSEWNTPQGHDALIKPKLSIRPGVVLPPLQILKEVAGDNDNKSTQRNFFRKPI